MIHKERGIISFASRVPFKDKSVVLLNNMSASAPSPLASSLEKTNGSKLSRLLIDGGTTVLRTIFDGYHPPAKLSAGLTAHSCILNALLRKRVLRAAQWDKLFPPGGAAPDSKTFDITLLFLLLTNICGLSPPPLSGWHAKPSPGDNSLEANLARVKFFRNELYGHVSSTGIDAPTFSSLWKEISAVLVALGLDQTEIDKLKEEKCGAEDYLDVLLEWAKSEEELKSHLADLRGFHGATQRSINEVRDTQLEDHKTLQDSKSMLREVHRSQSTTQRSIEDVRQTQLEDHKMLQDSKSVLGDVHQTQTKIQSTIQGAARSQDERFESLQTGLQEVKQAVGELNRGRNSGSQGDEVLRNLVKSEFKGDIEFHVQRFQEDTRGWVFSKVENWLDDRNSQNRVMVICGNAGMGKSVISAAVCKKMQVAGRLCGSHFIQHNNVRYRKPQLMLQSLACHMCYALPEFKLALVKQLKRNTGKDLNDMGVEELFALLFKEPLSSVEDPGRNMLIVIDGLDESDYHDRNELLEVIADHFCKLPMWIRFLVTSRPERNIAKILRHLQPFQLEAEDEQNQNDIKRFIGKKLECIPEAENTNDIVENLVEKSEGLMLYANFLLLYIEENPSVLKQGDEKGNLPLGISSVYHRYFKRLESELMTELGIKEDSFLNFLSALAASREPLPIDFASRLLLSSTTAIANKRKLLKAINSVSSLLPVRGDRLHIFHKSIKDWLTDECCYGVHDFTVDEKEGHRILTELCAAEFEILVQRRFAKSLRVAQFNDKTMYALQHGVRHMLEVDEDTRRDGIEDVVRKYVINQEIVYAKLCVNSTVATEDIACVQKEKSSSSLNIKTRALLETLLSILRKNSQLLREFPHVFLQTVLNEGGSVLSLEANKLLSEKYPEISYMRCSSQNQQESVVEARFHCSSEVACFDISPDKGYMVCECSDATIQLWSLKTGIREWTKPVLVKKTYSRGGYCEIPSNVSDSYYSKTKHSFSFYQSVVFHPNGEFVLPGKFTHVYTIDGEQTQLFNKSDCRFSVCKFIGEKKRMLSNCIDNSKCLVLWKVDTGEEISRITRAEDIVSFQCSADENLLAISHSTGLICLIDLENEFAELSTWTWFSCGFMKFCHENRILVAFYLADCSSGKCYFSVPSGEVIDHRNATELGCDLEYGYPMSCSGGNGYRCGVGFLDGDTPSIFSEAMRKINSFWEMGSLVQLNGEYALMSSPNLHFVSLINLGELSKFAFEPRAVYWERDIIFSINGEIMYAVTWETDIEGCKKGKAQVAVWECSSMTIKREKQLPMDSFVPVKDGVVVLMRRRQCRVELWNVELTECKHHWNNLEEIWGVISISEEQVACYGEGKVTVLSASGDLLNTITYGNTLRTNANICAVSTKYEILSTAVIDILPGTGETQTLVRLSNSPSCWEIVLTSYLTLKGTIVSPKEDYCVIWGDSFVQVLYVASGELHRRLIEKYKIYNCKFITEKHLIICSKESHGSFLRLINVESGQRLTTLEIEKQPTCLGVCPCSLCIAVGLRKLDMKIIQVHLSETENNQKRKRSV